VSGQDELLETLVPVVELLHQLGVDHYIGGSIASSAFGEFRATNDADIVADLRDEHAAPLAAALQNRYYVDLESVRGAIRRRASFNVIHLRTMLKVDVFVQKDRAYDREALRRREAQPASNAPGAPSLELSSSEDVILAKLDWYRQGGEVSERQWRDVQGVLRVQSSALDVAYLRRWAPELGVTDLLERALAEADLV
jgi:hypothetical protein